MINYENIFVDSLNCNCHLKIKSEPFSCSVVPLFGTTKTAIDFFSLFHIFLFLVFGYGLIIFVLQKLFHFPIKIRNISFIFLFSVPLILQFRFLDCFIMATLYTHKDQNTRLTWVYLTGFLVFVILVGWIFSRAMGNSSILYGAVIFAIVMNFVSYWWSDKIVLAISGAKEVTNKSAQGRQIIRLVENLCITAGLPLPKVYIINDPAPNAFATGRNPEHSAVALTTGIIKKLEKRELEGVIAHELSHIGNKDILLSTVVTVLVGFIALLSDWFMRWSIFGGSRRDENREGGQLQLIFTVLALVLAILAPIAASLMKMAISRKREFLADADGALLTRFPEGLASALEKISADDKILESANKATAHMYIANPLKGDRSKGFAKFFMTHPPVEERIKKLREM